MKSRGAQVVLGLLVSSGLLALVLSRMDLDAALARLASGSLAWLGASLVVSTAVLWARGLRFHAVTSKSPLSVVTAAIATQNFLLRVTPLRLGELSLPYILHRRCEEPAAPALVKLVLIRLVELWVLLATAIVAGIAWFGVADSGRVVALTIGVGVLTGVLLTFERWLKLGIRIGQWLIKNTPLGRIKVLARALGHVEHAVNSGGRLTAGERWALGPGTVVVMGLQFALYGCLVRACGLVISFLQVLVGASAAQVAGAIPVITVGSIGTHETGWAAGFVWVGLDLTDAIMSGVFTQITTLLFAAVFAVPAWLFLRQIPADNCH